jgi:type II secretory pathway component PulF
VPLFKYKAVALGGGVQTGMVIGKDVHDAREILRGRGLSVVRVYVPHQVRIFVSRLRILEEVVKFFEYLCVLLGQKISLTESLDILEAVADFSPLKKAIHQISDTIHKGFSFSKALAQHSHLFSEFIVQCCDNAEKTGNLCEACQNICTFLGMRVSMLKMSRKTLFYPFCVLGALLLLFFSVLQYVIPVTKSFIMENTVGVRSTSISQKLLFSISDLFVEHSFLFVLIFVIIVIFAFALYRRWLRTSLFYEKQNWIFWVQMFSTLLLSGVAIKDALQVSNSHMPALKLQLKKMEESIINGASFYQALTVITPCLPSMLRFAKIGEANGLLGKMLFQCAQLEQEHLNNRVETMLARLSPIILVFAGGAIVWLISSVFVPLYDSLPGV